MTHPTAVLFGLALADARANARPDHWVSGPTEQAVMTARALLAGTSPAPALTSWARSCVERGEQRFVDADVRRVLAASGPAQDPRDSLSAGACARGVAVGLALPSEPVGAIAQAAREVSLSTHATALTVAGCAAIAAAVSGLVDGADPRAALSLAMSAADEAAVGLPAQGPDLAARITWASSIASQTTGDPSAVISLLVGTTDVVQEAVPAALALANLHADDLGGAIDAACALTTTSPIIPALVGAIVAAHTGEVPGTDDLTKANPDLDLAGLGEALLSRRRAVGGFSA